MKTTLSAVKEYGITLQILHLASSIGTRIRAVVRAILIKWFQRLQVFCAKRLDQEYRVVAVTHIPEQIECMWREFISNISLVKYQYKINSNQPA